VGVRGDLPGEAVQVVVGLGAGLMRVFIGSAARCRGSSRSGGDWRISQVRNRPTSGGCRTCGVLIELDHDAFDAA
jgi:hypothetical protein